MGRIRKYYSLPKADRSLFREALFNIYRAKLLLLFFSFKKLSKRVKSNGSRQDVSNEEVLAIKKAIGRANTLVMWKNKCLVNTLAVRWMLNRRNIASEAYLGVKKTESGQFIAHAWIVSGGQEIIPKEQEYVEMHAF